MAGSRASSSLGSGGDAGPLPRTRHHVAPESGDVRQFRFFTIKATGHQASCLSGSSTPHERHVAEHVAGVHDGRGLDPAPSLSLSGPSGLGQGRALGGHNTEGATPQSLTVRRAKAAAMFSSVCSARLSEIQSGKQG